jgi:hypothetical protein
MSSYAALAHAAEILDTFTATEEDPRRTRIDFLQVANYLANRSREDEVLFRMLRDVSRWSAAQTFTEEDLAYAAERGWPIIEALPGPIGYYYSAARLVAHGGLRSARFVESFEDRVADSNGLAEQVRHVLGESEPDLLSAGLRIAAERATEDRLFRSRLIAAAKDVQRLVTDGELPARQRFSPGDTEPLPEWPPLRLGVLPIGGGRWDEDPRDDWDSGGGGWTGSASGSCSINSSQTAAQNAACVAAVVIVIIIIIAVSKA